MTRDVDKDTFQIFAHTPWGERDVIARIAGVEFPHQPDAGVLVQWAKAKTATDTDGGYHAGLVVRFVNGWSLSLQWGYSSYSSNRDHGTSSCDNAEAAVYWLPEGTPERDRVWCSLNGRSDNVEGWCDAERALLLFAHVAALPPYTHGLVTIKEF